MRGHCWLLGSRPPAHSLPADISPLQAPLNVYPKCGSLLHPLRFCSLDNTNSCQKKSILSALSGPLSLYICSLIFTGFTQSACSEKKKKKISCSLKDSKFSNCCSPTEVNSERGDHYSTSRAVAFCLDQTVGNILSSGTKPGVPAAGALRVHHNLLKIRSLPAPNNLGRKQRRPEMLIHIEGKL